jgi:hypothetical protein
MQLNREVSNCSSTTIYLQVRAAHTKVSRESPTCLVNRKTRGKQESGINIFSMVHSHSRICESCSAWYTATAGYANQHDNA